ncbi:dTDP-4-dehydrorhamnose reductase [Glaciimonas sp. Gout2]|uniref:dTDP-4-dehydrorhamnose reductase n=1 Tax=unclassified Glaciimonas TaxID=2644401 RepID=UPI002B23C9C8|nr:MULTISPECIES: dTDP-4-dehydrorhamnose reductase [unclassified Glaciimonas]MEB0013416.1 dTDP-4-dehydrorhamnose reductase [Glaciimonas sp. Cout2]MEB0082673.1 dTDP-4-dehydrorhamnose reductase [Glaciimonas sp. Gout2]
MKILVTGKNGQVGYELERSLKGLGEIIAVDRSQMDLSNLDQVRDVIRTVKPNLIINAAAYTAVDKAESEPELAMRINGEAPGVMAEEAQKLGAAMIHYSTDYVFDGTKKSPYTEEDITNPQSVYGRTKREGEIAVAKACEAHWIMRTSWVYGVHGGNFLKTILRLAQEREAIRIVADQTGAPTWARTIARVTTAALETQESTWNHILASAGIYNLCASGETTWHGYAKRVVTLAGLNGLALMLSLDAIEPIPTEAYPLPAPRPGNSRLATDKLQNTFKLGLPDWHTDLDICLSELIQGINDKP